MREDVRHAFRALAQAPGWAAVILLSFALGIGANVALFRAVDALLLRDVAVAEPEALVRLGWTGENDAITGHREYGHRENASGGQRVSSTFSYPVFQALEAGDRSLAGLFASAPARQLHVIADGRGETATGFLVSGRYFELLGVGAARGRALLPEDDDPAASPATVISHAFWAREFGLDPGVLGRVVRVNDIPITIVGILPAGYRGVQHPLGSAADLHLPLSLEPRLERSSGPAGPTRWWLQVMGRLAPGGSIEQVRGNLEGIFQGAVRAAAEAREPYPGEDVPEVRRVPRLLVDSGRRGVYDPSPRSVDQAGLLGGVVALLLLVVCANVTNLMLTRALVRRRELAIRLSLGATRRRVVRLLAAEGAVLGVLGGALGLAVAIAGRRLLPFGDAAPLDGRVIAVASLLSLAVGVLTGLVPALRATRAGLWRSLGESGRGVARSRSALGRGLLVLQVAVSLALVAGAGLFLRTLQNLRGVDVGFDPERVLLFALDPGAAGYEGHQIRALHERVAAVLRATPGVVEVGLSGMPFLGGWITKSGVYLQGSEVAVEGGAHDMAVSPEFFEVMGIPLLAGRGFGPRDAEGSPPVALVNPAAARAWFGGESPLGRRFGDNPAASGEMEIVGVVGDVRAGGVREAAPPTLYRPHTQQPPGERFFVVKAAGPPAPLTPTVRAAVQSVDPTLPLLHVSTQSEQLEARFGEERALALACSLFGGLATLLAAIGLFGLASYDVAQRTREIGVRMAVGAEAAAVVRMVLRQSLFLVVPGLLLGVALSLATGRLLAGRLFGLEPWDGATLAQAALALLSAAALAVLIPARRAARVDPVLALRSE